jgi:hypothetical protein
MAGLVERIAQKPDAGERAKRGQQPSRNIQGQLLDECVSMIRFASASGLSLPPSAVEIVWQFIAAGSTKPSDGNAPPGINSLVNAHARLSRAIAPATPRSVRLLEEQKPHTAIGRVLGPIRLIRQMMVFSSILLLIFVSVLSFTDVATIRDPIQVIVETPSASRSLWIALFYLSAAGLGAAFAGLFRANQSVDDGTFDSTHESSYWTMIVLGLIGGTLLAQILPNDFEGLGDLTKPLLALLGGFSAPAVYSILDRLVQTVQALVQGDGNEKVAAQEREAKARVQEEAIQNRMQLAARIVKLQEQIYKQTIPEDVRARVATLLDDVLVGDLESMVSVDVVRLPADGDGTAADVSAQNGES